MTWFIEISKLPKQKISTARVCQPMNLLALSVMHYDWLTNISNQNYQGCPLRNIFWWVIHKSLVFHPYKSTLLDFLCYHSVESDKCYGNKPSRISLIRINDNQMKCFGLFCLKWMKTQKRGKGQRLRPNDNDLMHF